MPRGIPNAPKQAKNTPVASNTKRVDSQDIPTPQSGSRTLKSTGDAKDALEPSQIVVADHVDHEKAQMLAFMNEKIEVRVADSSDVDAEQIIVVNVNGRNFPLKRGEVVTVPRYVADWLARQRKTAYKDRETVNAQGVKDVVYDSRTSKMYDFSVERDDNPLGRSWLAAAFAGR